MTNNTISYELKLDDFAGPMDKLLELIEARELEITKINIASVTADFIEYIKKIEKTHPRLLADFIAIASKLILIKSHTLLPSLDLSKEEEDDIADLENRLLIYKEFKNAEKNIKNMWTKRLSYGRDFLKNIQSGGFFLTQQISPQQLCEIVAKMSKELTAVFPKMEVGEVKLISFEEKMKELMDRVSKVVSASFDEISRGRDKTEVVVLFLAILHLLNDSMIKIEQGGEFEDIKITKI